MTPVILPAEIVIALHDAALNPGEMTGLARDKSLSGALSRVDNRLIYGLITDVFELAAAYCLMISRGHRFNDGNNRTAFDTMNFCLEANGISLIWPGAATTGQRIIACAQGLVDEDELATWLKSLPLEQ